MINMNFTAYLASLIIGAIFMVTFYKLYKSNKNKQASNPIKANIIKTSLFLLLAIIFSLPIFFLLLAIIGDLIL